KLRPPPWAACPAAWAWAGEISRSSGLNTFIWGSTGKIAGNYAMAAIPEPAGGTRTGRPAMSGHAPAPGSNGLREAGKVPRGGRPASADVPAPPRLRPRLRTRASVVGGAPRGMEGVPEIREPARLDRRAHAGHQRLVVPEVVQGAEDRAEHFVAAVQVPQVGATVAAGAGGTAAAFLDRPRIALELRVADPQRACGGEVVAVARVAGGHHAVEHV